MNHWIFIANETIWDWRTQEVGKTEIWSLEGKKIDKKIFSEIQEGDKVIG